MAKGRKLKVRVPGKVILSGEHAVVYGYPAVVAAVDRFLTISISWDSQIDQDFFRDLLTRFESCDVVDIMNQINAHTGHSPLTLESEIPLGCGMGSSAALASGLSLLTLHLAGLPHDLETINKYAFLLEKQAHENPSGVDNTIVTNGGILRYLRTPGQTPVFSPIKTSKILNRLYLVNTGKPDETTAQMVGSVRRLREKNPELVETAMEEIARTTDRVIEALAADDEKSFKQALHRNGLALEKLEVVSPSTQKIMRGIEKSGGAAKITGAGGRNRASGVILVFPGDDKKIQEFLKNSGLEYCALSIDGGIHYTLTYGK